MFNSNDREAYENTGYFNADGFLPEDLAAQLLDSIRDMKYETVEQVRHGHYSHVFSSEIDTLPKQDDSYAARFDLAENPRDNDVLMQVFEEHLVPAIKDLSGGRCEYFLFPNVYRLGKGHYFRSHVDSYAGISGYSFFVNDGWKWDYGGILSMVHGRDDARPIFPFHNRALLRNEEIPSHHFLPVVPDYVDRYQYIILGWADEKPGETSKVRGD